MERQQLNQNLSSSRGGVRQGGTQGQIPETTFQKQTPLQQGGAVRDSSQLTGLGSRENLGVPSRRTQVQGISQKDRWRQADIQSVNYSSMRFPYYKKWSIFQKVSYNQATGIPRKRIVGPTTFVAGVDESTLMHTFWLKGQPNKDLLRDNYLLVRIGGMTGIRFQQNYDLKNVPRLVRFRLRLEDATAAISDAIPSDLLWRHNRPLNLVAVLPIVSLQPQQERILRIELLDGTERVENLEERPLATDSIDGFLEVLPGSHQITPTGGHTGSSFFFKRGHILGLANIDISNLKDGHRSELRPGFRMSGPLIDHSYLHCVMQLRSRAIHGEWLSPAKETSNVGIGTQEVVDQTKRDVPSSLCNLWEFRPSDKILLFR